MESLMSMYKRYTGDSREVIADIYPVATALQHTLVAAACFCVLSFCTSRLVPILLPGYYKALPDKKKEELAAYVTSTVHHLYVVPCGLHLIYFDLFNTDTAYDYKADMTKFISFVAGYLIADMIFFALPDAMKGKFITSGHHVLGLFMVYSAFFLNSAIARFIPQLLICELSSLVFNISWLVKTIGPQWSDSGLVIFLEYLFAISFTLTRVLNIPQIGVGCVLFSEAFELKVFIGVLMALCYSLQVYWFFAILKALNKKAASRSDKKGE